ncbi:MAG TPA: hypothetical protein VJN18_32385 [Polyangiaceae bacterium]|nr:hypothetical protein [Polyangiaceae bacterium]
MTLRAVYGCPPMPGSGRDLRLPNKFACSECVALITSGGSFSVEGQGARRCDFCGTPGCGGPLTVQQCQDIIDGSRGKRVVAGGDGTLRATVGSDRAGKYVHVLDVANVGGPDDGEPWFTCRVQGETPGPSEIYPAYPRSAIDPYVPSRENLKQRVEGIKAEIRAFPTAEKLRLAADFLQRGSPEYAASIAKLAIEEAEGRLPLVPMPPIPANDDPEGA